MTTIFGKIIEGTLPAEKVFENDRILVIKDKYPQAPVHLLIMPKKEISNLQALGREDLGLVTEMILVAQQMARQFGIEEGYRLMTNNGEEGGQVIFHFHFHLLGGKRLSHQLG
jgi:histidine triad (HIT) family protein